MELPGISLGGEEGYQSVVKMQSKWGEFSWAAFQHAPISAPKGEKLVLPLLNQPRLVQVNTVDASTVS
jgi:hypothetical protein